MLLVLFYSLLIINIVLFCNITCADVNHTIIGFRKDSYSVICTVGTQCMGDEGLLNDEIIYEIYHSCLLE